MKKPATIQFLIPSILSLGVVLIVFIFSQPSNLSKCEPLEQERKHRGAHVFSIEDSTDFALLEPLNLEWVTMVPWAFQKDCNSPELNFIREEEISKSGWAKRIKLARSRGYKVFLKPHVWIHEPEAGNWRPDIFPENEENWKEWKAGYTEYIVQHAKVAELGQAEMLCIGTELSRLALEKPEFWVELAAKVREVYSGKITYAANWYKEYEKVAFWSELDYIGVQAYFPLCKKENPTVEEIEAGWEKHLSSLREVHEKNNRKVIFTELGYKSTTDSATYPWEWIEAPQHPKKPSLDTQANCYQAFFNVVWEQPWFGGAHFWQIRTDYLKHKRKLFDMDYFPQGKPAEKVIAKGYE